MSRGFTLIEMAMVVMVIFLLMSSLLIPLPERINLQKIKQTEQTLEEIKEALIGFAIVNGRLPCPALTANNGQEAGFSNIEKTLCQTYNNADGYLPWATLGVGQYDAWGRPFRYRVDGKFSDAPTPTDPAIPDPPKTAHFLEIQDNQGKQLSAAMCWECNPAPVSQMSTTKACDPAVTGKCLFSDVIALVFSCGKNGRPDRENDADRNWNDNRNCDNPTTEGGKEYLYIQDVPVYIGDGVDNPLSSNYFDDILIWLPRNVLINRLVTAGKWPPTP